MFWAYFDETVVNVVDLGNQQAQPTEMFVGGCIASQEQWEKFTRAWTKALGKAGVRVFHAREFYQFRGEFKWLTKSGKPDLRRHARFRDKLADIIVEHVDELIVFTSMAPIRHKGTRKAYEDAAMRALWDFTKYAPEQRDSLYVVLARHPELSPWSILRKFEALDWEGRLAGCGILQPNDVPPLQAADFVLHSLNKRWKGLETASFNRLKEGCLGLNKQFWQQIASSLDIEQLLARLPS
jgi:hypothetical protein